MEIQGSYCHTQPAKIIIVNRPVILIVTKYKTHLATAIAVLAIQHHRYRVRLLSTIELANALELEKQQDKHGKLANRLMQQIW